MEQQTITKRIIGTKWRLLWILIAAAWLFVFLKLFIGMIFKEQTSLVAAFSVTNPEEISATVEITAKYPDGVLTEAQKQQILGMLAGEIHLTVQEEPEVIATASRQEMIVSKEAKAASTQLKVISLLPEQAVNAFTTQIEQETQQQPDSVATIDFTGENHLEQETAVNATGKQMEETRNYLYARINLKQSLDTILTYKALLEEAMQKLSCTEISTTIQLVGDYPGYLPLERRNEITEEILDALGAEVVYEYREADLYTVYAYTGSLENYITVEGRKINLHIAMSQNEEHYRTILYLASPILPDTW